MGSEQTPTVIQDLALDPLGLSGQAQPVKLC